MGCVPIAGLLRELDTVIGEDGVDAIGDGLEQMFEEFPRGLAIRLFHELGHGKLAGPVNADEEIELSLHRLNLGNVDMEEANGVSFETLPLWFVALDIRQARDAMPLKASMQR